MSELSEAFLDLLGSVTAKRAKIVIDHILQNGFITNEDLKTIYNYQHPPRAIQDVRDYGIPLEKFLTITEDGRKIAAYRFTNEEQIRAEVLSGRKSFSKDFKKQMIARYGSICAIHLDSMEDRYLQIDHRVPYQISGDASTEERSLDDYMLVCGSANRIKSWSCEHCPNWNEYKSEIICKKCYWAFPENYDHIAMQQIRRVDITWSDPDIWIYESLAEMSMKRGQNIADIIKEIIFYHITRDD